MFGGGGPDFFKQVKEENIMELIDTANRFAVHTLLTLIIRQVILKPIYLKKMTVDQMLLKWDNHPFVLRAILQELQQRINDAPQVDDIMEIFNKNAVTLSLCDFRHHVDDHCERRWDGSYDTSDSTLSTHAHGCIVINWMQQLETYPPWVETVKKQMKKKGRIPMETQADSTDGTKYQFTVINFPPGESVDIYPCLPECWVDTSEIQGYYRVSHLNAERLKSNVVEYLMFESGWRGPAERECYVGLMMAVRNKDSSERVFAAKHLTKDSKFSRDEYIQGLDGIFVSVSGFDEDMLLPNWVSYRHAF